MFRPLNNKLKIHLEYSSEISENGYDEYSLHMNFETKEEACTLFKKMNAWNIGLPIQLHDNRITFLPVNAPNTAGVCEASMSYCHNMIHYLAIYIPHADYASILFQAIALDNYKMPCLKEGSILFYKHDLIYPARSYTRRTIAMNVYKTAMDIQLTLIRHGVIPDIIALILQVFISLIRHADVPQLIELHKNDRFHLLTQSVPFLLFKEKIPIELSSIQYSYHNNQYSLHIFCATKNEADDLFQRIKEECNLPVYKNRAMPRMLWISSKQHNKEKSGVYSISMTHTTLHIPNLDIHFSSVCHKKKFIDSLNLTHLPPHLIMDPHEKSSTQLIVDKTSLSEFNIHTLLNAIMLNADKYLLENTIQNMDVISIKQLKECCLAWSKNKMQPEEIAHFIQFMFISNQLTNLVIKRYFQEVKEILEIIGICANMQNNNLYTDRYSHNLFSKSIQPKSCVLDNNAKKESCLMM